MPRRFGRRAALKGLTGAALASAALPELGCSTLEDVPPPNDPVFGYGVASGDPLPDAVILWTRVSATATIEVRWEISREETFGSIVAHGSSLATAERDFTVKVDVAGLEPATTYFYRFIAYGRASPIGRTRTAPLDARNVRFAIVSCASLPHGYFHVYRALAERGDLDAVIHLGDYIYEYAEGDYGEVRSSEPKYALETLSDYRERYAQYRRDPDLREAHRLHPFICIWDDHEVIDNAYRDGTTGDNPRIGAWEERKLAATRAYSEWIPIRDQETPGKIWRALRYGDRAELFLLDTRLWGRDVQVGEDDPRLADPRRQLLGRDQEAWLGEVLRSSTAQWKLVCQQVMMTNVPVWFRGDGWDDYPAARERFYDLLERAALDDVVVLSGDVHSSWANDLVRVPGGAPLAVELIAPAITSPGNKSVDAAELVASASTVKYVDLRRRGFIVLELSAAKAHAAWFHVQNIESRDGLAATFSKGFAAYTGENRLREENVEPPPLDPGPLNRRE